MRQRFLSLRETLTTALRSRKITTALIIANLCLLTLYVSGWTHGSAQIAQQKAVLKHFTPSNEPIDVTQIRVKAKAVKLGKEFDDGPDWLKHVTFRIKNKSDKVITFLQIDLDFPETEAVAGAIMMRQLFFGQRPDFKSTLRNPPLYLQPNETMEVSLEKEYGDIKALIELKYPSVENINKLTIRTSDIVFEDGTLYAGGMFFRRNPDPDSPQKWLRIPETQGALKSN